MERVKSHGEFSTDSAKHGKQKMKLPPPVIDLATDRIVLNEKTRVEPIKNPVKDKFFKSDAEIAQENRKHYPSHWTDDMIKFYNDDWGGERQFNVERLQAQMDKDPSLWSIDERDLLYHENRKFKSIAKCWNCCQFGHTTNACPEELQVPKCHMCGEAGHIERSCPRAICLSCGNQMSLFVLSCYKCMPDAQSHCSRCLLRGHNFINCSDNWRRFHSTTGQTKVEIPKRPLHKPRSEMWCCNCSQRGHIEFHCPFKREKRFPETFPFVSSYENKFVQDIYSSANLEDVDAAGHSSQMRKREHSNSPHYPPRHFKYRGNVKRQRRGDDDDKYGRNSAHTSKYVHV